MPVLLQICVEGNTGSTGRLAEALGKLAIENNWVSYIAHGRFSRPSQSKIIKIGTKLDVAFHGLLTRLFDMHGLGSRKATMTLIKTIDDIKPDIIHLHHLHGYYINIKILFNYLAKQSIPVIWTFHDCWSFTGHCAHFDYVGCNKWKTECSICPQKHEYPASFFIDRSNKNFHLKKELFTSVSNLTIVPVSGWLGNVVGKSFLKSIPRTVIYNGINTDLFRENIDNEECKQRYSLMNKFVILGVANPWSRKKGLFDFIELSKRIDENMLIVMVGLTKSQIKTLPSNILGLSRTENQAQLKDLYSASDVFLNLSVEETFGLTTAEALACGTPAIVYDSTACPEIVDSETGFVVAKGDIDGILDSIRFVERSGKKKFSQNCRKRAVSFFNLGDRLNDYFKLYKKVLINSENIL